MTTPEGYLNPGERLARRIDLLNHLLGRTHRTDPERSDLRRELEVTRLRLALWLECQSDWLGFPAEVETAKWHWRLKDGELVALRLENPAMVSWRLEL